MNYGLDYEGDSQMTGAAPSSSRASGKDAGEKSGRKRASQDEQTITYVTVSMMLSSRSQQIHDSNGLQLPDGRNLYHVQFIAAVRSLDDNSTHILYHMEDGTGGVIQVKQWLEDASECSAVAELRKACSKDATYLKVVGQLKDYEGQKIVLADSIRPLTTPNQITHHFLQVLYYSELHKKSTLAGNHRNAPALQRGAPMALAGNSGSGMRQAILTAFSASEMGSTISKVVGSLSGRYPEDAIRQEIQYLSSEGKLYSTIDEEHFGVA